MYSTKPRTPPAEGEILFLALALVDQLDLDAVVQEREFAQALGQDLVVELDVVEDLFVGQEVHFGAALLGRAGDLSSATPRRRSARLEHAFHRARRARTP
jgi:hypothetical protein